jgi:hypothetical protein
MVMLAVAIKIEALVNEEALLEKRARLQKLAILRAFGHVTSPLARFP